VLPGPARAGDAGEATCLVSGTESAAFVSGAAWPCRSPAGRVWGEPQSGCPCLVSCRPRVSVRPREALGRGAWWWSSPRAGSSCMLLLPFGGGKGLGPPGCVCVGRDAGSSAGPRSRRVAVRLCGFSVLCCFSVLNCLSLLQSSPRRSFSLLCFGASL